MEGDQSKALPLEGGGLGWGVRTGPAGETHLGAGAQTRSSRHPVDTPPTPTLPPSRGKGEISRVTGAPKPEGVRGSGIYERVTYTPRAAGQAKRLRRDMNVSERRLWEALRALKLNIRRQAPIGRFIPDFVHLATRLVIEVDGAWHSLPEAELRDHERDTWLRSQGFEVVRIRDRDACEQPRETAERIAALIECRRR
ncbi:DUF559 domain-containing protein [Caulobacter sp. NIBR1757]|uniref:endonuclease domain-containing protein n=1 Tax=Caulobacter sp. NIBR1757 TaxID=3016000 RepID=UPI0022EFE731|nr:DUF559 domain-containing protein [Caulobacter sp. NIBR1757]WGM37484.1 hypothetical protein AMEJIAPC_00382 [Caulobacter sp. NIBR1757]